MKDRITLSDCNIETEKMLAELHEIITCLYERCYPLLIPAEELLGSAPIQDPSLHPPFVGTMLINMSQIKSASERLIDLQNRLAV